MKLIFTRPFIRDYQNLPAFIQTLADKQLELLLKDPNHPSLRTKKIKKEKGLWEGRITKGFRFSFQIFEEFALMTKS